jgi:hypothetical protein
MAGVKRKGGKKNRKFGRNKKSCELYRSRGRREHNRERRLAREGARQERRAKLMPCGHGSRHRHPDGDCRRCYREHNQRASAALRG